MVNDIKIIRGKDGLFVSMPSRKRKNGDFKDVAHPLNSETRRWVEDRILGAYRSMTGAGSPETENVPSPDTVGQPTPSGLAAVQAGPAIVLSGASFDQSAFREHVEQAHEARTVDADERGQILLADAIAGLMEMDQGCPGGIGQPDGCQPVVEFPPPAPREADELEAEPKPVRIEAHPI